MAFLLVSQFLYSAMGWVGSGMVSSAMAKTFSNVTMRIHSNVVDVIATGTLRSLISLSTRYAPLRRRNTAEPLKEELRGSAYCVLARHDTRYLCAIVAALFVFATITLVMVDHATKKDANMMSNRSSMLAMDCLLNVELVKQSNSEKLGM
eukprot:GILJ01006037.1.p1 GENE.GILJ01006037.1~~GILJ01006037.1.p1  ORF type:complete len:169 (-),score=13.25 GILJ01006037.1:902-1351(-)